MKKYGYYLNSFGKIERIRLKLSEIETSLDSYIVFACSDSAADGHSKLNGHTVNGFTLRTRLFDVCNLKDDSFDYFPKMTLRILLKGKPPCQCGLLPHTRMVKKIM